MQHPEQLARAVSWCCIRHWRVYRREREAAHPFDTRTRAIHHRAYWHAPQDMGRPSRGWVAYPHRFSSRTPGSTEKPMLIINILIFGSPGIVVVDKRVIRHQDEHRSSSAVLDRFTPSALSGMAFWCARFEQENKRFPREIPESLIFLASIVGFWFAIASFIGSIRRHYRPLLLIDISFASFAIHGMIFLLDKDEHLRSVRLPLIMVGRSFFAYFSVLF